MAIKRITFLQELLGFVGLEGRLHLAWVSSAEAERFVRIVTEFTEKVRGMGPSPVGQGSPGIRESLGGRSAAYGMQNVQGRGGESAEEIPSSDWGQSSI
jgi:F420-non-reducing hydrogenase iron-sulfur subunit